VSTQNVSNFLNQEFYRARPADHLQSRIQYLVLLGARGDDVWDLMSDGVEFGRISVALGQAPTTGERASYVTTEAQAVFHHAAEALLRLFIAHRNLPPCPWIELARMTSFGAFKESVEELAGPDWSPESLGALLPVFLGQVDASQDDLIEAQAVLQQFLQLVSRHYLDGGRMYNAIKHGFAVQSAHHRVTVGDPDDSDPFFEAAGETVTYLEHTSDDVGRHWKLTTMMMSAEHALALATFVVTEVEALWTVAQQRYVPSGRTVDIPCINRRNLQTLQQMESEREMTTFSRGVFDEPRV